ncbi:hypothetical protein GAO09_02650 [Rhizobiales bacterium RZME27]|uniref:Uncharacterized protein n=1 Tax=Endobacterium cereale TaxID=2663029 RepID=A0A6A8A2G7_9HYPH|nr:hypothetical protein [Endobacterium cereale]MEB2845061.1 hypothetical protein [Endobacterium cereale]MQY44973.1 hypothetical protein [Endobacterium cereale]
MDKLGEKLGISREDGMSSYACGRAIEGALKSVSASGLNDLGKELGLGELDFFLTDLVAAIKYPWGEENDRLERCSTNSTATARAQPMSGHFSTLA